MLQLHTNSSFFKFLSVIVELNIDENTPFIRINECKKIDTYFFVRRVRVEDVDYLEFNFVQRNVQSSNILRDVVYLYSFSVEHREILKYIFSLPNYKLGTFLQFFCNDYCKEFYAELITSNCAR